MQQNTATKALIAMPGHSRLFRRGAMYYFRMGVPQEFRSAIGKTEIIKSLRTTDFREAKRLVVLESAHADELLAKERRKLKRVSTPPQKLGKLSEAEIHRLVFEWF